ncbi:MAG TPA: serine/threonine-protein kinase, partial [Ktedonobacteraceae bacterium]|nr:serine/threonine-protein kinase [Ktedonobacteraceae bacterium]
MHDQDLTGQVVGHYRILRKLNIGEMATIYLAQDLHLQRQVAIKVFRPQSEHSPEFLRRFTREAQVLANLDHPHILPIHDYGEQEDFAYLVMPFLTRGSLKERLVSGPALLPEEALQLIEQVLLALHYAHEQGLVHRDIKPANLLFKADGSLLLSNFSLSQMPFAEDTLSNLQETPTETSDPFSTLLGASAPHYMAPEQLEGQATPQSDLYSIGVVLYELLTGSRPFVANSLPGLHLKHLTEQPPAPRELNPRISPELEAVVLRALAKDPRQRFQSAGDFLQALRTSRGSTGNGDNLPEVNGERPPRTLLPLQEPHSSVQQQMLEIQTPEPRIVKVRAGQRRDSIRWMVPLGLLLALVIILASARALVSSRTQTLVPQKGNAVPHSTPGNTITVPSVSHPTLLTNCPQQGTTRRAVLDASPSSVQNNHQNLVYLAYGEAGTELERYDVVTKKTSLILASPGYIRSAQISADGHWILFARTQTSGFALQLVRTDGQA